MTQFIPQINKKAFIIIFIISFVINYVIEINVTRHSLLTDSRKINNIVSDNLDYVSTLGTYLGKQIANNNKYNDLYFINNLFKETAKLKVQTDSIMSWGSFSWSDKNNKLSVNTISGVKQDPDNLTERFYIWSARYEPWKLQISKPDYGVITNSHIIPAGIGISSSNDEYKGTIVFGINFKKLISKIESSINSPNAFIVISKNVISKDDSDRIFILSSNSAKYSKNYSKIVEKIEKLKYIEKEAGSLPQSITAGRFKYIYYKAIDEYSLVTLVGYNIVDFWLKIISSTLILGTILTIFFLLFEKDLAKIKIDKKFYKNFIKKFNK